MYELAVVISDHYVRDVTGMHALLGLRISWSGDQYSYPAVLFAECRYCSY